MFAHVELRPKLRLEVAAAHEVKRIAAHLHRFLHHAPGHQFSGPVPAMFRAMGPHPQQQLFTFNGEHSGGNVGPPSGK